MLTQATIQILIVLAVGPGLVLLHAVYVANRYDKEPLRNLGRYLLAGGAAAVGAGFAHGALAAAGATTALEDPHASMAARVVATFLGVALVEETAKAAALLVCVRRDRELTEPFDWVVYSVSIALGFAILENLGYVLPGGVAVGIMRAFTAVPAHALDGTMMGHHLALAATHRRVATRRIILALVEPTLWHGAYDALLFQVVALGRQGNGDLAEALALPVSRRAGHRDRASPTPPG